MWRALGVAVVLAQQECAVGTHHKPRHLLAWWLWGQGGGRHHSTAQLDPCQHQAAVLLQGTGPAQPGPPRPVCPWLQGHSVVANQVPLAGCAQLCRQCRDKDKDTEGLHYKGFTRRGSQGSRGDCCQPPPPCSNQEGLVLWFRAGVRPGLGTAAVLCAAAHRQLCSLTGIMLVMDSWNPVWLWVMDSWNPVTCCCQQGPGTHCPFRAPSTALCKEPQPPETFPYLFSSKPTLRRQHKDIVIN